MPSSGLHALYYGRALTDRSIAQEEKRRLILDAAVRVFARSGYHDCRVGDITEEAGVAHGLLYHYFKSKDEVLEAVFRDAWGDVLEAFRGIEESDEAPREQLATSPRSCSGRGGATPTSSGCSSARSGAARRCRRRSTSSARRSRRSSGSSRAARREGVFRSDLDAAPARVDLLRRDRGDPDRLGARAAAGRRRRRRSARSGRWSRSSARGWRSVSTQARTSSGSSGSGAFGLAFSITTTAAYLPPLLEQVHRLEHADRRSCSPPKGCSRSRCSPVIGPVERHVPDAAGPPPAVHARGARADRLLPR